MADGRAMQEILKNHGLVHLSQRFQLEKISPDIFCLLISHEMEELGVQNKSDMMNLGYAALNTVPHSQFK